MSRSRRISAWLRTNQGVGAVLTAFFTLLFIYLWQQDWTHREMRDGFTLGFFPLLGVGVMLLCSVVMMVDKIRKEPVEELEDLGWLDFGVVVLILIAAYLAFWLAEFSWFVVSGGVFLFAMMALMGLRPLWQGAVLGPAIALLIYLLFNLIGIRIPTGWSVF